MRIGLVVPCYIDVFYPEVGVAALELLEKLGIEVEYPFDQTCCGQPMANSGCEADARAPEELFIRNFPAFEYIVIPSGSCTLPPPGLCASAAKERAVSSFGSNF